MCVKKVLSIFFFFSCFFLQSQNNIIIDDKFEALDLAYSDFLNYYPDVENIETPSTILNARFSPFLNSFSAQKNIKCWFKFNIDHKNENVDELFLRIKAYSYFNKLKVYKKIGATLIEVYEENNLLDKTMDIPFEINKNQENQQFFIEVFFKGNVYFPIQLVTSAKNQELSKWKYIKLSLFYGFCLLALIINILFLIATKDKFFSYYSLLLFFTILSISNLDGFFYALFGNSVITENIKLLLNILVAFSYCRFTVIALDLKTYYPKIKNLEYYLVFAIVLFYTLYLLFSINIFYSLGKLLYFSVILFYFIMGIIMIKRSKYAKFLVIGYSILLISHILFLLPITFGSIDLGFTDWHYKIGSAIEIIVFLYAISYRHKLVENEKELINQKLMNQLEIEKKISLSEAELFNLFCKEHQFTSREKEIVEKVLEGKKNKDISTELFIELSTVKYHLSKIFIKLDISKRTQVISKISDFKRNKI